ncbi:XdhC family protein [Allorhizobium terrae]|uniref:XdhC family protein n=1 Tax=Allorhizobium terrae TaxID=1848972 RepID=A0A4S3ZUJ1_9HYPH|nr:XdhC family protein [Allorhizobium terrae]THF49359.1 XdhC family protein [Allorhizobium terrae]
MDHEKCDMKHNQMQWDALTDYVLDYAIDCARKGNRYVIVTLVRIDGSSPRYPGAQMVVSEDGSFIGYLSGGCIERAIVAEALGALTSGQNRLVRYGEGSEYFDIQLPCGSGIDLYFDVSQPTETLISIDRGLQQRCPQIMTLHLPAFRSDIASVFTVHYRPRRQLIIAGSGPSAVQLARLAIISEFDVQLLSPDAMTREHAKSLGVEVIALVSTTKTYALAADARTAVVFMFHDHLWEDAFMPSALASPAYYIGAIGNEAAHVRRREALLKSGFSQENIERIHGPAGLFRGSKSARDIAISVLADIVKNQPSAP